MRASSVWCCEPLLPAPLPPAAGLPHRRLADGVLHCAPLHPCDCEHVGDVPTLLQARRLQQAVFSKARLAELKRASYTRVHSPDLALLFVIANPPCQCKCAQQQRRGLTPH